MTGDLAETDELARVVAHCRPRIVINAAGLTKQHPAGGDLAKLVRTNSVMPRRLEHITRSYSAKLIHFSSVCVFAGTKGSYREEDLPDASDGYGLSKYLGEVSSEHCLTLRTSVIGRGLLPNGSLIDWFLGSTGQVKGYGKALFSGMPVCEVAELLFRMLPLVADGSLRGLYHLSAAPIDKLSLLRMVAAEWKKTDVDIRADDTVRIDRTLDSTRLKRQFGIVPDEWTHMITRMHEFYSAEA
jgi:dTDP-4-dehydrorhamnose reductase